MSKVEYMVSLAETFEETGDYERAAQILHSAVRIKERNLGPEHGELADNLFNLGLLYQATDKHIEAERLLRRAYEIYTRSSGDTHRDALEAEQALKDLREEIDAYSLPTSPGSIMPGEKPRVWISQQAS
ncbi:MAG: tetratricopeptide repeat protein [Candidatus Obscuribacterales bacterium]|nr:tetratricopeptide repeat protein [Candidatus Obscuribacterales bacterium]